MRPLLNQKTQRNESTPALTRLERVWLFRAICSVVIGAAVLAVCAVYCNLQSQDGDQFTGICTKPIDGVGDLMDEMRKPQAQQSPRRLESAEARIDAFSKRADDLAQQVDDQSAYVIPSAFSSRLTDQEISNLSAS